LQFVLILPDGSKSLVPADWTDFQNSTGAPRVLSARRLGGRPSGGFAS
jgi:hypothetical protein